MNPAPWATKEVISELQRIEAEQIEKDGNDLVCFMVAILAAEIAEDASLVYTHFEEGVYVGPGREYGVTHPDPPGYWHCWARLEDGTIVDAARRQFGEDQPLFVGPFDPRQRWYLPDTGGDEVGGYYPVGESRWGRWSGVRPARKKRVRNSDHHARSLERAAAMGDVEARAKHLMTLVRAGRLTRQRVCMAAWLGDEAAALLCDMDELNKRHGSPDQPTALRRSLTWAEWSGGIPPEVLLRFAVDAVARVSPLVHGPLSDLPARALAAAREILDGRTPTMTDRRLASLTDDRVQNMFYGGVDDAPHGEDELTEAASSLLYSALWFTVGLRGEGASVDHASALAAQAAEHALKVVRYVEVGARPPGNEGPERAIELEHQELYEQRRLLIRLLLDPDEPRVRLVQAQAKRRKKR